MKEKDIEDMVNAIRKVTKKVSKDKKSALKFLTNAGIIKPKKPLKICTK